jgi:hypothetical protein
MTLPTVRLEDVPKPWRGTVSFLAFALAVATLAIGLVAFVRSEARAEATVTTRAVLADDLAKFKTEATSAATNAAREGAEKAVREAVAPIAIDIAKHRAEDDERVSELKRRVGWLESHGK